MYTMVLFRLSWWEFYSDARRFGNFGVVLLYVVLSVFLCFLLAIAGSRSFAGFICDFCSVVFSVLFPLFYLYSKHSA